MALDPNGNLYLALREGNAIYRIDLAALTMHHVAGTGERGHNRRWWTGRAGDLGRSQGACLR